MKTNKESNHLSTQHSHLLMVEAQILSKNDQITKICKQAKHSASEMLPVWCDTRRGRIKTTSPSERCTAVSGDIVPSGLLTVKMVARIMKIVTYSSCIMPNFSGS